MARLPSPCGTYSAYKRHLRKGEDVDPACREASKQRSREQAESRKAGAPKATAAADHPAAPESLTRQQSLEWNLRLVEAAMRDVEPAKLAPLSKRHSELLVELSALGGGEKEVDPFDEFFSGDLSNVTRFPASKDREAS